MDLPYLFTLKIGIFVNTVNNLELLHIIRYSITWKLIPFRPAVVIKCRGRSYTRSPEFLFHISKFEKLYDRDIQSDNKVL